MAIGPVAGRRQSSSYRPARNRLIVLSLAWPDHRLGDDCGLRRTALMRRTDGDGDGNGDGDGCGSGLGCRGGGVSTWLPPPRTGVNLRLERNAREDGELEAGGQE